MKADSIKKCEFENCTFKAQKNENFYQK